MIDFSPIVLQINLFIQIHIFGVNLECNVLYFFKLLIM
jgi:hypothetical protein